VPKRTPLVLSSIVAITLAVSGCGVATPAPSASPTEMPTTVEPPLPQLPITCGDLVTPATVAGLAGKAVPLIADQGDTPDSWWEVVERQSGMLTCGWGEGRDFVTLSVNVVPDATSFFTGYVASILPSYYERYDAVGDRSVHRCAYGACSFNILVGDYLIGGYALRPELMDELDLEPLMLPVLQELADSVAAAIPEERAVWVAPESALAGWGWGCDEAPIADLGAIVGLTDAYETGTDWEDPTFSAMLDAVAPSWCTLASEGSPDRYLHLVVVKGGGWVADEWQAEPPTQWYGQPTEPISLDGIGAAYLEEDTGQYNILFTLKGSFVSFGSDATSREEFLDWTVQVAELLTSRTP
jgi:hypothetical protein